MNENDKNTKEQTLADSIQRIGMLEAENKNLKDSNAALKSQLSGLESQLQAEKSAHEATKAELETLSSKEHKIEEEVAKKAASIAANSGANPISAEASSGSDFNIDEISAQYKSASSIGKAKIIEKYGAKIKEFFKK